MKKINLKESLTLKINDKINTLRESGKKIYNLTSGQLNFRPPVDFIKGIEKELNFLKSFQYAPNAGFKKLRQKFFRHFRSKRNLDISQTHFDCIVTGGSKFAINLSLGTLLESSEDEVILITPYWGSYPEMIKMWDAKLKTVDSFAFNSYIPNLEDIEEAITANTKVIILNSPNNPAGIHYDEAWMKGFAEILQKNEQVHVISDEVYFDLCYYDPKPSYFYQYDTKLLERTIIVDGISKSLASTGLRVGYAIASKKIITNMTVLQSQLSSGPNSLIQNALINFDLDSTEEFLETIQKSVRNCAQILRDSIVNNNMSHSWYQTSSGFYFFIDFTKYKFFERVEDSGIDHSSDICEEILDKTGVALVPGTYFGMKNSARLSMTLEEASFKEAIGLLMSYLTK